MGTIHLYVDADDKEEALLKKAVHGKELEFELAQSELDDKGNMKSGVLDGAKVVDKIAKINSSTQVFSKLKSKIKVLKTVKAAGTHKIEVEVEKDTFTGKINVVAPEVEGEEDVVGLQDGQRPGSVTLSGNKNCPKGCPEEYHKKLIAALSKPTAYFYSKNKRLWTVDVGNQTGHRQGKGWKCYIDAEDGAGTKWRLEISWKYDEAKDALAVSVDTCAKGH